MHQRVLVTGGANGIGREIARAFAANRARVFVCDNDAVALDDLAREIPGLASMVCDLSSRADIGRMVAFGRRRTGGAGRARQQRRHRGADGSRGGGGSRRVGQGRESKPHGRVRRHAPGHSPPETIPGGGHHQYVFRCRQARLGYRSPYCTTKWGLIGFTKTLAVELGGFGIRANAILPGAVDGPRVQAVLENRAREHGRTVEEVKRVAMAGQSIKTLVDPRDVAALAVFLASDSGKSISGQMLPIDGDSSSSPG